MARSRQTIGTKNKNAKPVPASPAAPTTTEPESTPDPEGRSRFGCVLSRDPLTGNGDQSGRVGSPGSARRPPTSRPCRRNAKSR